MAPTVAQMRARMLDGHREILAALVEGRPAQASRAVNARGLSTCRRTLLTWGAIRICEKPHPRHAGLTISDIELTDIGRILAGIHVGVVVLWPASTKP